MHHRAKTFVYLLSLAPSFLLSLPQRMQSCHGDTSLSVEAPNRMTVTANDGALIDWESFSIGQDEEVRFTLPNEASLAVNRVVGREMSEIHGSLLCNGQLVLLNSNGIYFGKEARIDTGSLIASTLDLNRDIFLSSKEIYLSGASIAQIVNDGRVFGRNIHFAAFSIEQNGLVHGIESVSLLGVDEFSFSSKELSLSAGSRISTAGSVECLGSDVRILADEINIASSGRIDVSSRMGGGSIFVGGGRGGSDPLIPNARWTKIDEGALLTASGSEYGSGGSVVVWGTELAAMAGRMEAEGGQSGGDGGFLELSSKNGLYFLGTVSTLAPYGKTGMFLLDPTNITIGTTTDVGVVIGAPTTWTVASNPVNIAANTAATNISLALVGSNVSIDTLTAPDGGVAGDILVTGAITWSSGFTLTLNASQDLTVRNNIQHSTAATGGTVLTLTAGRDILISGTTTMTSVGSQNSGTVVTAAGNTVLQGGAVAGRGAQIGFFTPALGTSTGPISVNSAGNLSLLGGTGGRTCTQIGHGQPNFASAGGVAVATAGANITVVSGGNILIQGGTATPSDCVIGHGAPSLTGGVTSNQDGNISVTAGGNLTMLSPANGAANIGHGDAIGINGGGGIPVPLLSGNINVLVGQDLTMTATGRQISIGHYGQGSGTFITDIEGNIQVAVGRDIAIRTNANAVHTYIGHNSIGLTTIGAVTPVQMRVAAGRDVTITNGGSFSIIGSGTRNLFSDPIIHMTLDLEVCRNLTVLGTVATNRGPKIGNVPNNAGLGIASTGEFFGSVGGDLTVTMNAGVNSRIQSFGDFNLAVQGTAHFNANLGTIHVGPISNLLGDFRMFAGGSILCTHAGANIILFGTTPASLDFRAGGDIQIPNGATVAAGQPISYQANHSFVASELWTTNGAAPFAFATVCGQVTNIASFVPLFSNACANVDSPAIASTCGSVVVASPTGATMNFVTTGPLTMAGGCTSCSLAPSNITIGPAGDINIPAAFASANIGSFQNIILNDTFTTTGPIAISACDHLTIQPGINLSTTNPGQPITLTADANNNGLGNLTLQGNLTTSSGAINLFAGPAATSGTSSIIQNGNSFISSTGGNVTALAFLDITFSGSPLLLATAGGSFTATANTGTISLDENATTAGGNATLTAGLDILINPSGGSISTVAGNLSLFANNDIVVNGDPTSLSSTAGAILVIADVDNTGFGNLTINQTISSTTGDICCAAGPGTFGCSQNNCHSGLISGFPFGFCTVDINGGSVTSTSGSITITSASDIIVNGLAPSVSTAGSIAMTAGLGNLTVQQQVISTGSTLTTFAGNNTDLIQTGILPLIQAAGEIRMITGLDMTLNPNTEILSNLPGDQVTLIVDNLHPSIPAFPVTLTGKFTMLAGSKVTSGSPLRIFTAYSQVFGTGSGINFIDPTALLNGQNPYSAPYLYPTAAFNDTLYEQWCVFFGCPSNYPFSNLGTPFTIFYKICLAQAVSEAMDVVTQFFVDLHPYNEFPGWMQRFWVSYASDDPQFNSSLKFLSREPYMLRRRNLNIINHPKSWTVYSPPAQ